MWSITYWRPRCFAEPQSMQKPWQFRRNFHLVKNCRIWTTVSKSQLKNSKTPFHNPDRSRSETRFVAVRQTFPFHSNVLRKKDGISDIYLKPFQVLPSAPALHLSHLQLHVTSLSLTMIPKTNFIACFNVSVALSVRRQLFCKYLQKLPNYQW